MVKKETNPAGGTAFNFTLDHAQTRTFPDVQTGIYTLTEADPALNPGGFDLTSLVCAEDGTINSTINLADRQATIHLDPAETVTCTFLNTVSAPPNGQPTDAVGVGKDQYWILQKVYATGSGFIANTNVDVHILPDLKWSDGMAIPPDVSSDGMNTLPIDAAGNLGPAVVWRSLLTVGQYDVVFDANQNGLYDLATDLVDDPNHPGFVVEDPLPVGGMALPVSKLGLVAPWLVLVAVVAVGVVLLVTKQRQCR